MCEKLSEEEREEMLKEIAEVHNEIAGELLYFSDISEVPTETLNEMLRRCEKMLKELLN